jgi:hypothetical protein
MESMLYMLAAGLIIATIGGVQEANHLICDAPFYHNSSTYKCHCPELSPVASDFLATNHMKLLECTGHARYVAYPCEVMQIWLFSAILSPIALISRVASLLNIMK